MTLEEASVHLADTSVIVTGGANGLGSRYAQHLVDAGAQVVIADIDDESAGALAKRLNDQSDAVRCVAVRVDATREDDMPRLVETTLSHFSTVDVLINNAGTYPHPPFEEISYDLWRRVLTLNLDSVFLC